LPGLQDERASRISLDYDAGSMMVPLESVTALGIALTELISNSYRHAFPDHEGAITVTLARSDDASTATLTIQDNGVGFAPKAVAARRGLGIVRRLLMQIGGTLDVCSVAGTRWTLVFPVPADRLGASFA